MYDILSPEIFGKLIKFGLVGFSGLFVDFGFTWLCKEKLRIQKYVSNAIGFTLAASTNYMFNRIWTFQSSNPEIFSEYSEFLLISMVGLLINTLILWLIVSRLKFNFYLSKLFAIAVVTLWNFAMNLMFTFG